LTVWARWFDRFLRKLFVTFLSSIKRPFAPEGERSRQEPSNRSF